MIPAFTENTVQGTMMRLALHVLLYRLYEPLIRIFTDNRHFCCVGNCPVLDGIDIDARLI